MPVVKSALWSCPQSLYSIFGKEFSSLTLEWNGSVSARLADKDERALLLLEGSASPASSDLQKQVAASVESAWWHFRKGDSALAERALGGWNPVRAVAPSPT
jgi:hypothetical protein